MLRAILIVLLFGLFAQMAPAQPGPADEAMMDSGYGVYGEMRAYGARGGAGRGEYGVEAQIHRLVERWKASKQDAERGKIETWLRNGLKHEFKARLAAHEKEINELEEKVRQLRERLALRKEKQDEIVEHRLQQILRDAQGLGWGSEGRGSSATFYHSTTTEAVQPASDDLFGPPAEIPAEPPAEISAPREADEEDNLFGGEASSAASDLAPARN
jgi:hypothetical protein